MDRAPSFDEPSRVVYFRSMLERNATPYQSIKQMPCGLFWTRESGLTPEQAQQQSAQLYGMPVRGTDYLLQEGEAFLTAVPFRHRN